MMRPFPLFKLLIILFISVFYVNFSFAREVNYNYQDLKTELRNTNTELSILKEQYRTLEDILHSVQREFNTLKNQQRQQNQQNQSSDHLISLNSKAETNFSNVQRLSQYANQTSAVLSDYQKRIADLEHVIATQKNNFAHLETAVKSLIKLVQNQNNTPRAHSSFSDIAENSRIYKVKSGDSLERISKKYNVSILDLKKANLLKNDLIIVGQDLQIP